MATFASWLTDQGPRTDAIGWFSRYWKELSPKPRLSSPSSIGSHLEDREQGGFRAEAIEWKEGTCTGGQVREAYDLVLKEYRHVRDQVVQAARAADAVEQPQLPGMEEASVTSGTIQASEMSPGEIVSRAAQAGREAAARHQVTSANVNPANTEAMLIHIARGVELIQLALGIARDEDGAILRFPPAVEVTYPPADGARVLTSDQFDWAGWWEAADLTAEAP